MYWSPCSGIGGLPPGILEEYSTASVLFELWLVLREAPSGFPTLLSFYHDSIGCLSMEEVEELKEVIAHKEVSFFLTAYSLYSHHVVSVQSMGSSSQSHMGVLQQDQRSPPTAGALQQVSPSTLNPVPMSSTTAVMPSMEEGGSKVATYCQCIPSLYS